MTKEQVTSFKDWTPGERERIADDAYKLYDENPEYSRLGAVKAAVESAPEHRRAEIPAWGDVKSWVLRNWSQKDAERGTNYATVARPKAPKHPRKGEYQHTTNRRVWNPEENEQVARAAALALYNEPGITHMEALRRGMLTLDEKRQKPLKQRKNCESAHDRMLELIPVVKKAEEKRLAKEAAEREALEKIEAMQLAAAPAPEPAPVQEAPPVAVPPIPIQTSSYQSLLGQLAAHVIQDFMGTLGQQVTAIVESKVAEALANLKMPEFTIPVPSAEAVLPSNVHELKTPPKNRLPKICVVGLLNQQAEDCKRAFLGVAEFVFVKSQRSGGSGAGGVGMVNSARTCDVVIAMTQFIGHDVENARKDLSCPFVRINGSVSALKQWIQRWLNGEVALAA